MKPIGQDPLSYRLTKVEPLREFVDETSAGSLLVRVSHRLSPLPSGQLRITYQVEIDGPAEDARTIGPMITSDFPDTVAALIEMANRSST